MRFLARAAVTISVGLLVWGCSGKSADEGSAAAPEQVVSVQVARVERRTLPVTFAADGVTDVLNRETVLAPIDGTVLSLRTEVGSGVARGDTLMTIRTRASDAAIAGAQRLLAQATTPALRADAEKTIRIARESQQVVPIVAGGHGVVVSRAVSAGQIVASGAELVQIVDLATLDFIANVPLGELGKVKTGQACRIDFASLPDRSFAGTVAAVSAQSNPGNQTTPVRIALDPPSHDQEIGSLRRVGMIGTATFITSEHPDALVVPGAALLRDDINDTYTIYAVSADSLAREIPVTVGVVTDSLAEVSGPLLHEGDMVIVRGNYEVSDSTRVTVETGS